MRHEYGERVNEYIVGYDYGTGGLWALVVAGYPEEITARYPIVRVFTERPAWMTADDLQELRDTDFHRITDEPRGVLAGPAEIDAAQHDSPNVSEAMERLRRHIAGNQDL